MTLWIITLGIIDVYLVAMALMYKHNPNIDFYEMFRGLLKLTGLLILIVVITFVIVGIIKECYIEVLIKF